MPSQKFIKNKEDFVCQKCGAEILGDGFTNHCPFCLWSMHIDVFSGDRANSCGGLMEPVRVEKKGKEYNIIHKCQKCGKEKINKADKEDNFDMLIQVASEQCG